MNIMPANHFALLLGRFLIAAIFVLEGLQKVANYEGTRIFMSVLGVPTTALPLVVLLEVVGGVCLVLGVFTRVLSLLFMGFCLMTALFFHTDFSHPIEFESFFKNFAIAGGFLFLYVSGPGDYSVSHWYNRRKHKA